MDVMFIQLPVGYGYRLREISKLTGESISYLIQDALEHTYIMSEKQLEMSDEPLPF
jgi:predicted DNA-binding protein